MSETVIAALQANAIHYEKIESVYEDWNHLIQPGTIFALRRTMEYLGGFVVHRMERVIPIQLLGLYAGISKETDFFEPWKQDIYRFAEDCVFTCFHPGDFDKQSVRKLFDKYPWHTLNLRPDDESVFPLNDYLCLSAALAAIFDSEESMFKDMDRDAIEANVQALIESNESAQQYEREIQEERIGTLVLSDKVRVIDIARKNENEEDAEDD